METGIKSSFIPQTPLSMATGPTSRGGGFDFFVLIALVMFVASGTLAVAVLLYGQYLSASAASKLDQLERAKQAFDPALIAEMTRLDDRMRAADTILSEHIAPTTLFHLLEQLTLQTVSFSALDFNSTSDKTTIHMLGMAESVNSIALQADLLSKSGLLFNPIFSNINRQLGGVRFDFSADIDLSALKYSIAQQALNPLPEEVTEPVSPFGNPQGPQPTMQPQNAPPQL